ncbi:M20/M25/M40 family metallo-hydrolase [Micromonospora aurantiaca]|uniref:M20 family metallopeptidase n=1 Tax=Micromonospora aurantiaca (nom. illeg.) TaxID=47850 RepID=UPI0033AC8C8B
MLTSTELLTQLISIPSVNPLLSTDGAAEDERKLAEYVADQLRSDAVGVELQEVLDGRCNVIGHVPRRGNADDAVILLSAHMDTYPEGGVRAGYQPVREGSVIYGRGSADAKGSLAAMMAAFLSVAREPTGREAYFVATVDEECLLLGATQLASHGMRPTLAITGEPTSLVPIVAQKGIIRGSFHVGGPKAHAAYPTPDTAITAAADLVQAVRQLNSDFAAEFTDARLGPPTLTVTRIQSDGGMNLAAREVTVWFDGRFLPGTSGHEFAQDIERRLRALLPDDVELATNGLTFTSPPNDSPLTHPTLAGFCATVRDVAGSCEPGSFAYGSEAGVLASFSDVSLAFGPGDPSYSHGEVELIDTDELETATETFRRTLLGR